MSIMRIETGIDKVKLFAPRGSFEIRNRREFDYAPPHEKQGKEMPGSWGVDMETGEELKGKLYNNFGIYGAKLEISERGAFLEFNPSNVENGSFGLESDVSKVYKIASKLLVQKSAGIGLDLSLQDWKLSRLDIARQIVHDECSYGDYKAIFDNIGGRLKKPAANFPTSHTWANTSRKFQAYSKTEHLLESYGVTLGYNVNRFEARYETGKGFGSTLNLQHGSFSDLLSLEKTEISDEWRYAAKRDVFGNGIQLELSEPIYANESYIVKLVQLNAKDRIVNRSHITSLLNTFGIDGFMEAVGGEIGLKRIADRLGLNRSQKSRLISDLRKERQKAGFILKQFDPRSVASRYNDLRQKLELSA